MNLLLLAGNKGCGKTTAADHLERAFGAVAIGMADPLKHLCAEVFGWSPETLHGPSNLRDRPDPHYADRATWRGVIERLEKAGPAWLRTLGVDPRIAMRGLREWVALLGVEGINRGISPRRALQTLGTEWGRAKVGPDVWVNASILHAHNLLEAGSPLVVISDGRFENEIDRVREVGGKVLRIRDTRAKIEKLDTHASERGLDDVPPWAFDAEIVNNYDEAFALNLETLTRTLFPHLP